MISKLIDIVGWLGYIALNIGIIWYILISGSSLPGLIVLISLVLLLFNAFILDVLFEDRK